MATTPSRSRTRKKSVILPPAEGWTPADEVAASVLTRFSDLEPSVRKIMAADLTDAGKLVAISSFRDSLDQPGDPNRHPTMSIETGRLAELAMPAPELVPVAEA